MKWRQSHVAFALDQKRFNEIIIFRICCFELLDGAVRRRKYEENRGLPTGEHDGLKLVCADVRINLEFALYKLCLHHVSRAKVKILFLSFGSHECISSPRRAQVSKRSYPKIVVACDVWHRQGRVPVFQEYFRLRSTFTHSAEGKSKVIRHSVDEIL